MQVNWNKLLYTAISNINLVKYLLENETHITAVLGATKVVYRSKREN